MLLPLAPSLIVTDPPDSVLSVTVTVLLPAGRSIVPKLLTVARLNVPAPDATSVLPAPSPMNVVVASKDEAASTVQVDPASTVTVPKLVKVVPSAFSVPAPEPAASSSVVWEPPPTPVPPNLAPGPRINRSAPLPKATSVAPPPLTLPKLASVP